MAPALEKLAAELGVDGFDAWGSCTMMSLAKLNSKCPTGPQHRWRGDAVSCKMRTRPFGIMLFAGNEAISQQQHILAAS